MATGRRIDALFCSREKALECMESLMVDIEHRVGLARDEVCVAVAARVEALKARQQELLAQIELVAQQKVQDLNDQLGAIEAGTCPPASAQHGIEDAAADPDLFVLCADATISFKIGEEDFLEKISDFGSITEASTYASQSYARGPALATLKVGNPSHFWVYACDKDGARRVEGGDVVEATVSAPEAFERLDVEDSKDGKYKVTLLPREEGVFNLSVTVAPPGMPGEDVGGGPFQIVVKSPTAFHLIGADDGSLRDRCTRIGETAPEVGSKLGTVVHPSGVGFDHTGRYLIAVDQGNHRVQVFDTQHPDGTKPLSAFGKKGLGSCDFDTPCDVVVDQENRVVVTDLLNHRLQILEFQPRTQTLRYLRTVESGFQFPKGLGMTDDGHLLVCDSGNHRVQVFNVLEDFRFVLEIGSQGVGEGQFNLPLGVAVNRAGEIIVTDSSSRISVFDKDGHFLRLIGKHGKRDGCFQYPASIAVSDEDALYVCDQGNRRIQVLRASDGGFLHKWAVARKKKPAGEEPDEAAADGDEVQADAEAKLPPEPELLKPMGIAINSHGLIVVADYESNLLWTF